MSIEALIARMEDAPLYVDDPYARGEYDDYEEYDEWEDDCE